jgi:hypothetical protein
VGRTRQVEPPGLVVTHGKVSHHTGCVREAYVHAAILVLDPEADERAPGASVTVALCGHWDHEPPCPLSPHHVHADRTGDELRLRVVFATEPENEAEVRRRIEHVLSGQWPLPEGFTTLWRLEASWPEEVSRDERGHAERLLHR